ncbi:MAG: ATP-binding protein [Acidimicrobiaceae bacterium]|nr:ATP-binding protein [Acidimicrobiaceae bacterium]MDE0607887.1 ATP-binding protein [Acidimicrobiaceae bacterium]
MSLELENDPSELERMAGAVEEFAEQQDWSPEVVFKVNLVLEELVVNVMTHGSHEGLAEIEVTVTSSEDLVSIRLSDNGIAFNPLTDAPDPEVTGSVEDRHVGGLGVHLVRTMMDEVSYQRENGRNLLTMTTQRN